MSPFKASLESGRVHLRLTLHQANFIFTFTDLDQNKNYRKLFHDSLSTLHIITLF